MSLKKLSIIFSIALLVFVNSMNVSSAIQVSYSPKVDSALIKSIDYLNNNMYLLVKSISSDNFDSNQVKNEINFLNSLISELNKNSSELPKDLNGIIATIQAITSFYNLSLVKAEDYVDSKDANDLIETISAFSVGYNASLSLKEFILKAGK